MVSPAPEFTMGFDIDITMTLHMCPKTGKPFYYDRKTFTKIYDISEIVVPEQLQNYLVGRGHIFHAYTEHFNENDIYDVSVYDFLEKYPSWEDVKQHRYHEDDYWTEKDHDNFRILLQWCEAQSLSFRVVWSY